MRGLGYFIDRTDERDEKFGLSVPASGLASSATVEHLCPAILDQGPLNSCVGHAAAEAVYASHVTAGVFEPELMSVMFAWNLARAYEHSLSQNVGVSIRDLFQVMNWFGFCPERAMPYDPDEFKAKDGGPPMYMRQPSPKAVRLAYDHRAKFPEGTRPAYYSRIAGDGSLDSIRCAIVAGLPVIFGAHVSSDFVAGYFNRDKPVDAPRDIAGSHCMLVTGYDGDRFRVRNSWGSSWGDAGSCWFSSSYMATALDKWTVKHAPTYTG